jgi:site-specific DNA-methyltransferase (adenine-specific)
MEKDTPIVDNVFCGDCVDLLANMKIKCDGVITSPPYNLGKNPNHSYNGKNGFYNKYSDDKKPVDYISMIVSLFKTLENVITKKGVILLNLSYSSKDASLPYRVVVEIENKTLWKIRDTIHWKKPTAMPFQGSPRNLSRIVEMVFVFSMHSEFVTNKKVSKVNERTKQKFYHYVDNYIEARCYDTGTRKHHKATFSVEFAKKLIEMYFPENSVILDPFCGTGTTGVACKEINRRYIMIDIDAKYVEFSKNRLGLLKENSDIPQKKKRKKGRKKKEKEKEKNNKKNKNEQSIEKFLIKK